MLNSTTRSAKAAIAWAGSDIVVHFFIPDEELEDVIYDDDDDEGQWVDEKHVSDHLQKMKMKNVLYVCLCVCKIRR